MTIIRWFVSKTVREAVALRRHVLKLLNHQRDILKPDAAVALSTELAKLDTAIRSQTGSAGLKEAIRRLEESAGQHLRPYPHAAWRENVEVLLVAIAVAMGIRTFFLQPFKIPTGSMQPTLFGITSYPDYSHPLGSGGNDDQEFTTPTGLARLKESLQGVSYLSLKADQAGTYDGMSRPLRLLIFDIKQTVWFAGKPHNIWFPPDTGDRPLATGGIPGFISGLFTALPNAQLDPRDNYPPALQQRMGLRPGQMFEAGQEYLRMKLISGDHLFVDRLTYNFRQPTRGEIIVFETRGIHAWDGLGRDRMPQDQFYIKRLVGLGGEKIQIGNDRHLVVNGTNRLDAATPHFEFVYGFNPRDKPRDSHFSGHVNDTVAMQNGLLGIAPNFRDQSGVYEIPEGRLMVMGDNTMNSFDSRGWGDFSAGNVIGRSCFVYWPLSSRFGWANLFH